MIQTDNSATLRVGFIGLGNIGKPMAERLAGRSEFALTVFDVRPERSRDLVQLGAIAARSLRDLAERSNLIQIVVRTSEQVREVVLGSEGILSWLAKGAVIAVHSTVGRETLAEISHRCAQKGVAVLDAPVSGGESGARAGTLAFMIGGEPAVLERCRPVFELMASSIFHLGGIGAGQAGKLANNLLFVIGMVGAYESMRLAVAAGIKEETAAALLRVSSGSNHVIQHWERWKKHIEEDGRRVGGMLHKDIALALAMASELDVDTPLGSLVGTRIDWAIGLTADADSTHEQGSKY